MKKSELREIIREEIQKLEERNKELKDLKRGDYIKFNSPMGRDRRVVAKVSKNRIEFTDGTSIPNKLNSDKYEIEEINGEVIFK